MKDYYPKILMMVRKRRTGDALKGGAFLIGIVIMIFGLYIASDHAQNAYSDNDLACLNNDISKCPALLISALPD